MNATEIENLVLGGLALFLTAIGAVAWWLSAHPAKTRAFIYGVRHHPTVIRAEKRYRDQIEFLVRRFQPEGAFGLSYTLGLITLAASAWLFGSVLQDVLAQEELALFDVPVMSYIASRRVDWLVTCMLGVTYLGSGKFLLAVVIAVGLARLPQVKEVLKMFARCVTMHLKPKMAAQFKQTLESEVLPVLHRRQGFQDYHRHKQSGRNEAQPQSHVAPDFLVSREISMRLGCSSAYSPRPGKSSARRRVLPAGSTPARPRGQSRRRAAVRSAGTNPFPHHGATSYCR